VKIVRDALSVNRFKNDSERKQNVPLSAT
jgi:hypothetical protein